MRNLRKGMAMPVVMSLIVILVLIAMSVASTGIATLNMAGANQLSRQSVLAAEAGIASAFREILRGSPWTQYNNVAYGRESRYSVQSIVGPSAVAGQPNVPAGTVYLLATGTTRGRHPRRVGVLISGSGSPAASGHAIATAGPIQMQGGGRVAGSIKASQNINLQGGVKITPHQGEGRILAGEEIEMQGGVQRDPSQPMRARQTISKNSSDLPEDIARQIFPNDTTQESEAFIADYRFQNTPNAGETAEILPNPDPVALLGLRPDPINVGNYEKDATGYYIIDPPRPDVVQHLETEVTGALPLDDKIHLFVNGVTFQGGGAIQGKGTVVAGDGNGIEIQGGVDADANLLALRWPYQYPNGGSPSIRIQGGARVNGMVLAHDDVDIQGGARVQGMVVAYRPGGGGFSGQGGFRITFDAAGLTLPGFASWLSTPSGAPVGPGSLGITPGQPIRVLSWQRL